MKNLKLTFSIYQQALLQSAPAGVTDIVYYRGHGGVQFHIAYKGKIFDRWQGLVLKNITTTGEFEKCIASFWSPKFIQCIEKEYEKSNNSSN
jgi:hypothetical protein